MTQLVNKITVTKLVSQGRQGPPGPSGTGVGVKIGQFFLRSVANTLTNPIVLLSSAVYPFTIDRLKGLKTSTGTVELTIKVNGTAVTGLNAITVNTVAQDIDATALNAVALNGRVTLELANNSNAANLEFTMEAHA